MDPMEVNEMFADERYLIPYVNKEKLDDGYIHEFVFEVVEAYTGIRLFSGIVNKL